MQPSFSLCSSCKSSHCYDYAHDLHSGGRYLELLKTEKTSDRSILCQEREREAAKATMSVNPEETAPAAPAGSEETPLFDATMKKKKKVTLDVDAELGLSSAPPATAEAEGEDAAGADGKTADDELAEMFGSMKKKKKSASKRTQFAVDLDNIPKPRTSQMTAAEEKKKAAQELVAEADAADAAKAKEGAAEAKAAKKENGDTNGDLDVSHISIAQQPLRHIRTKFMTIDSVRRIEKEEEVVKFQRFEKARRIRKGARRSRGGSGRGRFR